MNVITRPTALVMLLLSLVLTTTAQQKRQTPARPKAPAAAPTPAPTFDTLLPADSYVIYGEVRSAGQLIRSNAINDLLEPVLKLAGPPRQFKSIVKWLNAHSEELMTSRLLVAAWPTNSDIPDVMIAVEFPTTEEAAKFATPLNEFMSTILTPPPAETPAKAEPGSTAKPKPDTGPTFYLQRHGSLVVMTPRPWTMKQLRPAGSTLLSEHVHFRAARNRFNSEPVFVYVDLSPMKREQEQNRKRWEQINREQAERLQREEKMTAEKREAEQAKPETEKKEEEEAEADAVVAEFEPEPAKEAPTPDPMSAALTGLGNSLFGGEANAPEGMALALSFEGDSFDLRALLVNAPGEKSDVIPFWPRIIPGAAIAPESPNILPANTELMAVMSLDLPQIYAAMSKPETPPAFPPRNPHSVAIEKAEFESPFAPFEKRLQLNIKDDVLPLLGSEIAIALPMQNLNVLGLPKPPASQPEAKEPGKEKDAQEPQATEASPILTIAVKDREALRALMPKLIDSLGFKGASSFAQTERREDTELVSYMNLFAYAFVGNFLVLSGDAATTRRVVDSYLKHETLAGDPHYKNSTRWQPRQLQGQIYISTSLMESYRVWASNPSTMLSDQSRAFLTRFSMMAQPVTYSLSNEGFGPLHEAHLPKSLVLMAVAGISGEINPPATVQNERLAIGMVHQIAYSEDPYKGNQGAGSYGSVEQLIEAGFISKETLESSGYKFEVIISGDKFEVSATPIEYGKSGSRSFFLDSARVLRGGDRNGAAATSSDPPIR